MLKKVFEILLLFLFVFGIPFKGMPFNSSKLVLLFLLILIFLLKYKSKINIKRDFLKVTLPFLVLLIISTLYTIIHGTNDYSIPYAYLIILIESFVGGYIFVMLFLKEKSFHDFLNLFVVVGLMQAFIIILMLLVEPFRNFIYFVSSVEAEQLMERYNGFRGFGLAGSVTYDLAVFLSITMIFASYLIVNQKENRLFKYMALLVLFIAIVMTGRTGWIGVFFSLMILFLDSIKRINIKTPIYILVTTFVISYIVPFVLERYYYSVYETVYQGVIPYAFEMFINYSERGSFSTKSSDILQSMYFPISEGTFLFGDGYYKNPNGEGYYMGTDAGYMREVLFYGIFPSILLYISYSYGFYKLYENLKERKGVFILLGFLFIYFFLAQYKGSFLIGSSMNIKLFCIFLFFSMTKKTQHNEFEKKQ